MWEFMILQLFLDAIFIIGLINIIKITDCTKDINIALKNLVFNVDERVNDLEESFIELHEIIVHKKEEKENREEKEGIRKRRNSEGTINTQL